jgi:hypothetical protein
MDVQEYLNRKYRDRRKAEHAFLREKEEKQRKKLQAYREPEKDMSDVYMVKLGNKDVDLKDPRQLITEEILKKLSEEEQRLYEDAHAKTHYVRVGGKQVDLLDQNKVITRVQYDMLSREDKQIYLVAHPRNPEKSDARMKVTGELKEYLDHKYTTGNAGIDKLNKSSFKWT